jgi:putative DNA methylase
MKKKLIEVALPLEAINRLSAEEKSVPRRGHPQTIHLWWARRPLAACRSVLFASLIDDPSSNPERFPDEKSQSEERQRLFRMIEKLANWENSTGRIIEEARSEILKACAGRPPAVLDPFCGGGSIPLEAQRLGLQAYGGDLNPVAILITRSLIDIPQVFVDAPAVNPGSRDGLAVPRWHGFGGLAADVRAYGEWIKTRAEEELSSRYPPGPNGERVLAYQWARVVQCGNPACRRIAPLTTTFLLSQSKSSAWWVEPALDRTSGQITFRVVTGAGKPAEGTVTRRGAVCVWCSTVLSFDYIRAEGQAGRLGSQLMAVLAEGRNGRVYLEASPEQIAAAQIEAPSGLETDIPDQALGFRIQVYGMKKHRDLFTARQLSSLVKFSELIPAAREQVLADSKRILPHDERRLSEGGHGSVAYADAIAVYLSLAVSRLATYCNTICHWNLKGGSIQSIFSRQAIPMSWDFMEICPFAAFSGNWTGAIDWIADVLNELVPGPPGIVEQLDAAHSANPLSAIVSTDPPYYDNIGYADLSDFFYVWLRKSLTTVYPALFSTLLVPKKQELIASPYRNEGSKAKAKQFFENGLKSVFQHIKKIQHPDFPMTVYYAFKQTENDEDEIKGLQSASTGWESMLMSLISSGFRITGTWPIRTEKRGRMVAVGTNALASSIVLVCRPKTADATVATRRDFLSDLRAELPNSLRQMQQGNIAPVDLAQASIGPGMAVFTKYRHVLETNGEPMTVRTALNLINQALDEVLSELESEFDPDTRWALAWFEQHQFDEGLYGEAEVLATAKALSISHLVEKGIVISRSGKVRLLRRDELPKEWNPATIDRFTVWDVTQNLIRSLDERGEQETANLKAKIGGLAEIARDLAYRLYTLCERKGWADEAGYYNSLVVAWPSMASEAFELK